MPIYEYRCKECGNTFSALVLSSDTLDHEIECPQCHEKKAEKQLSFRTAAIGGAGSSVASGSCGAGGFT